MVMESPAVGCKTLPAVFIRFSSQAIMCGNVQELVLRRDRHALLLATLRDTSHVIYEKCKPLQVLRDL
jgi:hypothetical protein